MDEQRWRSAQLWCEVLAGAVDGAHCLESQWEEKICVGYVHVFIIIINTNFLRANFVD
jgi:hypothetical protein